MTATIEITNPNILKTYSKKELQKQFEIFLISKSSLSSELIDIEEHDINSLPQDIQKSIKEFDKINFVEC